MFVAGGQGSIWSTGVPYSYVSADSRLHSVIGSLSYSQGLGPGPCPIGWNISPAGRVTQDHRDKGWPHYQEWPCHRMWTDGTLLVPAWHPTRPLLCHQRNSTWLSRILIFLNDVFGQIILTGKLNTADNNNECPVCASTWASAPAHR